MKKTLLVGITMVFMLALGSAAQAAPITFAPGDYDNTLNVVNAGPTPVNNQTGGLFRDVFWYSLNNGAPRVGSGDYINQGNSLTLQSNHAAPGPGPYTALNFTGPSVSGGQSYLSIYDNLAVPGPNLFSATGGLQVSADVLFVKHSSSGGVVALYNGGQDALALLAHNGDGNNNDHARVDLVWQSPGSGTVLKAVTLDDSVFQTAASANGNKIAGTSDFWYRVVMDLTVTGDVWTMTGSFFNHSDPNNPNSALGTLIHDPLNPLLPYTLLRTGSVSDPDAAALHLTNPGEIGVMAMGNESIDLPDNVGVSITNFDPRTSVSEPAPLLLLGSGLVGLAGIMSKVKK